ATRTTPRGGSPSARRRTPSSSRPRGSWARAGRARSPGTSRATACRSRLRWPGNGHAGQLLASVGTARSLQTDPDMTNKKPIVFGALLAMAGAAHAQSEEQGVVPATPTYDQLRDAQAKIQKLEEEMKSFEFHGYFRSGYGLSSAGGQMVAFQAPGAGAKYRL